MVRVIRLVDEYTWAIWLVNKVAITGLAQTCAEDADPVTGSVRRVLW